MSKNNLIQNATIVAITPQVIVLELCTHESCGTCQAKKMCASGAVSRKVTVVNDSMPHEIGQTVELSISRSMGLWATLLAYFFPVVLVVAVLFICQAFTVSEILSGVVTLIMVGLYFLILRLFRDKISSEITITIL
ncbi:MAG: SoxR reducing system RseC family protein [Mucinivorans sp.]